MTTLIYIAFGIVAVYVAAMIILDKKIPSSISDTYYITGTMLFTAVMWSVGFLFGLGAFPITPDGWEWTVFFTMSGLFFVGAACHCRDKYQMPVHYAGAFAFAIASQIWCIVVGSPWIMLTFITASGYLWNENRIFWAEINCIINLLLATLIATL